MLVDWIKGVCISWVRVRIGGLGVPAVESVECVPYFKETLSEPCGSRAVAWEEWERDRRGRRRCVDRVMY